jgi:hypothetical protein
VVLADVEEGALDKAASDLRAEGADVHARVVDHPEGTWPDTRAWLRRSDYPHDEGTYCS